MLAEALKKYGRAEWFLIVRDESIPVVSAEELLQMPRETILGVGCDPFWCENRWWYVGSDWVALTRTAALELIRFTALGLFDEEFAAFKSFHDKGHTCCSPSAYLFPTCLQKLAQTLHQEEPGKIVPKFPERVSQSQTKTFLLLLCLYCPMCRQEPRNEPRIAWLKRMANMHSSSKEIKIRKYVTVEETKLLRRKRLRDQQKAKEKRAKQKERKQLLAAHLLQWDDAFAQLDNEWKELVKSGGLHKIFDLIREIQEMVRPIMQLWRCLRPKDHRRLPFYRRYRLMRPPGFQNLNYFRGGRRRSWEAAAPCALLMLLCAHEREQKKALQRQSH